MTTLRATVESDGYPSPASAWWIVSLLFIAAIISYSDRQVMSLVVDPIRRDLSISDVQVGLLMGTAFAFIYAIAGIPLGFLADRISRRNLIAIGMLLWSIATICCGLARSFDQMLVARISVGLGEAVLSPAAISLISDLFPPERRGSAIGVYFTGVSIGIGSAVVIGGALLNLINGGLLLITPLAHEPAWRLVMILIGTPGMLWALLMFTFREPLRRSANIKVVSSPAQRPREMIHGGWWRPAPMFIVVAMAGLVDNAVAAWAPSLLIREFHSDSAGIGVKLGMIFMIGGAAGMVTGGLLSDRAQQIFAWRGRVFVCLIASVLALPIVFFVTSRNVAVILLAILSIFFASAWITSSGLATILDWAPNNRRGLLTSISFFVSVAVGLGMGPPAVPIVTRWLSANASLGPSLFLVSAGGYAIAVIGALATLYMMQPKPISNRVP